MAHELTITDGRVEMAYTDAKPWHSLGTYVTPEIGKNRQLFMEAANMNKLHALHQLQTAEGIKVDRYAVVRDDGKVVGNVGARYTLLQNHEAFAWFDEFLNLGEATFNTAGTLKEGAVVWILAKLNKNPMEVAAGDLVEKYLLLSHSHDGSLAVRVGFTPVRVVCANTLSMAHGGDASKLIRVKHSKNVKVNLENIRETMNLANQEFEATAEQYRFLANKQINQKDLQKYIKMVFALQQPKLEEATDEQVAWFKEGENDKEVVSTRLKHTLETVFELAEAGKGNNLPSIRGTYWSAYNGVTEYLSYQNGNNDDSRMSSLWYGSAAALNRHALETAVQLANAV
jgi:phage/plasmid-like protein (TIGR03299 family)